MTSVSALVLAGVLLISSISFVAGANELLPDIPNQPGNYHGSMNCGDILLAHHQYFSEYPTNAASTINFLAMGEPCNSETETTFIKEMQAAFFDGSENTARMLNIIRIWEKYRARKVSGNTGDRICNPKRLLECHKSLSRCVCRSTFNIHDVVDYNENLHIIVESTKVVQEIPFTSMNETVEVCRAKVDSPCRWRVPWLGICTIPCVTLNNQTSYCVGQPNNANSDGIPRCRICNPAEDALGNAEGTEYKCLNPHHEAGAVKNKLTFFVFTFTITTLLLLIINHFV